MIPDFVKFSVNRSPGLKERKKKKKKRGILTGAWNGVSEVKCIRTDHAQTKLSRGTTYFMFRCQQRGVPWNLNKQMILTSFRRVFATCAYFAKRLVQKIILSMVYFSCSKCIIHVFITQIFY